MFHPFYPWEFPDPAFPFAIQDNPGHGALPTHRHRFMECVFIVAGHGTHIMDGDASAIAAGDCFVIPMESAHAYAEVSGLHLINILFARSLLLPFQRELNALPGYHALCTLEPTYRKQHDSRGRLRPTPAQRLAIMELIRRMLAEYAAREPGYQGTLLALLAQLLIDLARYYQASESKPSAQLVQIGAAISLIEQEYAQPLTMPMLAEAANMSVRNLTRRFREGVGMPPIDYLIRLRLRHAAQLLRETPQPIADIARAVGMDDGNYLTRQFKRVHGVTPREFRTEKERETTDDTDRKS